MSNNGRIEELEPQLSSKNSEFDVALGVLETTEPLISFAEDLNSLTWSGFKVNGLSFAK